MFAPLSTSNSAAALWRSCAANIRALRPSSDEEDRTALMFAAQEGRKAVAELLLNNGANTDRGKKKQTILAARGGERKRTIFGGDFEKYRRNWFCVSKGDGVRVFSFYFARFGNFEDAFHSLAICIKSNVLLALLLALSCCVIQTKEFF